MFLFAGLFSVTKLISTRTFIIERLDFTFVAAILNSLLLISLHNVLRLKLICPTHFTSV
jgi:hypothetical protein